jgi:hypothetical protein
MTGSLESSLTCSLFDAPNAISAWQQQRATEALASASAGMSRAPTRNEVGDVPRHSGSALGRPRSPERGSLPLNYARNIKRPVSVPVIRICRVDRRLPVRQGGLVGCARARSADLVVPRQPR